MDETQITLIQDRIHSIRGQAVILDSDLADLYGVTTKTLNQAVTRNRDRFPEYFYFVLNNQQFANLRSQFVTSSSEYEGRRYSPRVFTEHGALMAATVLRSEQATAMSLFIMRAFVKMREALATNQRILQRLAEIEKTLLSHDSALRDLYQKLRPLLSPPTAKPKSQIGLQARLKSLIHDKKPMKLFAGLALTSRGWEKHVRVTIDENGRITAVESEVEATSEDQQLRGRILLPALANLHSHAFQRAMAGLTEQRLTGRDSFWSWRELMYRFLERLTPERIEAIAALVFMEMLERGYASVGEFHYVHHQVGGTHHDHIAETSLRAIAAAQQTGIGLTHLPVFYMQGGVGGKPLAGGQLRFGNTPDEFSRLLEQAQAALSNAPEDYALGIAPHSLRAVSPEALAAVTDARPSGPIHIHIAEQVQEIEEIQGNYGARPVEWLLNNRPVDSRWCLIHATHMTPEETVAFAKSGAVAGLCPITEANLGDGIFEGPRFVAAGGRYGVGSDSNVRISLAEELRLLEYSQRLAQQARNVLVPESGSVGRALYEGTLAGGAQALARDSGRIEAGRWADLLTLDAESLAMWGCAEDEILDRWIFAGDDSLVREVWSAGRAMVGNGRHVKHDEVERRYRSVIQELQQGG